MAEEGLESNSGMCPLPICIRCSHALSCGSELSLCIGGLVVYHLSCFSKLMLLFIPWFSFIQELGAAGEKELLAESITWM